MLFINQNDYPHIPYPTDTEHPGCNNELNGTVKTSGCGLCCACMMIDRLTLESLSLEDCLQMSLATGANHEPGTDMLILGPVLAERFNLVMTTSNSIEDVIACLHSGGAVIANPGGDQEGYIGLFTHGGHYILLTSYDDKTEEFLILDPSWSPTKFQEEGRVGKVREEGCLVYAHADVIMRDSDNRDPRFYMFRRKSDQ